MSANQALLDQVNAAQSWRLVRKTRPVWARVLTEDRTVATREGPVQAKAGDVLCRGEAGDEWPQSAAAFAKRYVATEVVDAAGWRKHEPKPDAEGALAARIGEPFSVVAPWGTLTGKAGDFLLKHAADREAACPEDVWVVDAGIFAATYEEV